jgi:probable rRNA maturation factor
MAGIKSRLTTLLRSLGLRDAELSILFCGSRAMRTLNREYRGKDRATDVLSFSLQEGRFPGLQPGLLGDIVIAVPVAEQQARAAGHSLAHEIDRLLVHGLLHLMGYDHEKGPQQARNMLRKEGLLLRRIAS